MLRAFMCQVLTSESACMVSSDVFDPISGRTSTYQVANVQ
jgi:hypothetical protein